MAERLVDLKPAAEQLSTSVRTLRRRIAEGALPAYRVGGRIKVYPSDVERLIRRIPAGRGDAA